MMAPSNLIRVLRTAVLVVPVCGAGHFLEKPTDTVADTPAFRLDDPSKVEFPMGQWGEQEFTAFLKNYETYFVESEKIDRRNHFLVDSEIELLGFAEGKDVVVAQRNVRNKKGEKGVLSLPDEQLNARLGTINQLPMPRVVVATSGNHWSWYRPVEGEENTFTKMQTVGDGKCGVHAVNKGKSNTLGLEAVQLQYRRAVQKALGVLRDAEGSDNADKTTTDEYKYFKFLFQRIYFNLTNLTRDRYVHPKVRCTARIILNPEEIEFARGMFGDGQTEDQLCLQLEQLLGHEEQNPSQAEEEAYIASQLALFAQQEQKELEMQMAVTEASQLQSVVAV